MWVCALKSETMQRDAVGTLRLQACKALCDCDLEALVGQGAAVGLNRCVATGSVEDKCWRLEG